MQSLDMSTYVGAQHDGCLLGGGKGDHLQVPSVGSHRVGDVADHLTGEALLAIGVNDAKGDGLVGVRHNGEVALSLY